MKFGRLQLVLMFFGFSLVFENANAEPVSIQSAFDTTGQGWLFGASGGSSDVECWVLAPRHVVSSEISGKSSPFTFVTKQRQVGFTGIPVVLEDIVSEEADMDVLLDFVFAPVESGVNKTGCLSRLGPPGYTYNQVLATNPEVVFEQITTSSSRPFAMKPVSYTHLTLPTKA